MLDFFKNIFLNLKTPLVVFSASGNLLTYINASAQMLLNPLLAAKKLTNTDSEYTFTDIIRFKHPDTQSYFLNTLKSSGTASQKTHIYNFENELISVTLTANLATLENDDYLIVYITEASELTAISWQDMANVISSAFHIAYHTADVNEAINNILGFIGSTVNVSRAYIFEEISPIMTANTYEWCQEGVEPAIEGLQSLEKEDYNYDVIVSGGVYVSDDIRELPNVDREILEVQGIKALAIVPLINIHTPIGYVGFDDCVNYRKWSGSEILLLENIATILVSLMVKRDSNLAIDRSFKVLKTISDNIDSIVYVSDINTHELIFINKSLSDSLNKSSEQLLGAKCWDVLQNQSQNGPCAFCPLKNMIAPDGTILKKDYIWEFQNTVNKRWYLAHDSIIKWVDGSDVHIETATDITHQKETEENLKYHASTDSLTGAYNREWGYRIINEQISGAAYTPVSLVFADIDNLKHVNDTYGHEAGDDLILSITKIIRSNIRSSDIICRWGGDEFLILLFCGIEKAGQLMKKIVALLEKENHKGSRPYILGISYGITKLETGADKSIDDIVAKADKLMYINKTSKKL